MVYTWYLIPSCSFWDHGSIYESGSQAVSLYGNVGSCQSLWERRQLSVSMEHGSIYESGCQAVSLYGNVGSLYVNPKCLYGNS
jgi:hypothetical protein